MNRTLTAARRAGRGLLRDWKLHTLSIFSLSVAFVCFGIALLSLAHLHALCDRWTHMGRVSVYLRDGVDSEWIDSLQKTVIKLPSVASARIISSAQARTDLGTLLHDRVDLNLLPPHTLPASIEVELLPGTTLDEIDQLAKQLRSLSSIEEVETYRTWTERIAEITRTGFKVALLATAGIVAASMIVVGATIRLSLLRRQGEIEVLRLVGASNRFVRSPFLIEGGMQGILGATGAIALLALFASRMRAHIDPSLLSLSGIEPTFLTWPIVLCMWLTGGGLGAIAALVSLRHESI